MIPLLLLFILDDNKKELDLLLLEWIEQVFWILFEKWQEHLNHVIDDGVICIAFSSVNGSDLVRWCTGCICVVELVDAIALFIKILLGCDDDDDDDWFILLLFMIADIWFEPDNIGPALGNDNARWWHEVVGPTVN